MKAENKPNSKNNLIFIVLMLSILAAAGVIIAQCFMLRGAEKGEPNTYLMAGDWYCYYDSHTGDGTQIRYDEEGGFGYACDCGPPVDSYDLYETYTYNSKTQTITVHGISDDIKDVEHKLLYCDENYLCLYLDGRFAFFKNELNEPDDTPHETAVSYVPANAPLLTVLDFDSEKNLLTIAPIDYDGDTVDLFEDRIYEVKVAPSVKLSSVIVTDDNGEVSLEVSELGESDYPDVGEFHTAGYLTFDDNGMVKEVVFYGELLISG